MNDENVKCLGRMGWPGHFYVLSRPVQTGGESNADYATRLAEFLHESGALRDIFTVNHDTTSITL